MVGRHLARAAAASHAECGRRRPHRDRSRTASRLACPAGARAVAWTPGASRAREPADGSDGVDQPGPACRSGRRRWRPVAAPPARGRSSSSRLAATSAIVAALRATGRRPDRRPPCSSTHRAATSTPDRDAEPATESTEPRPGLPRRRLPALGGRGARGPSRSGVRGGASSGRAIVFAADAPVLRLLALPFRLFVGGRLGSGRQWFSWIHVDDLVGIYRLAADRPVDRRPDQRRGAGAVSGGRARGSARPHAASRHRGCLLRRGRSALVLRDQADLLIGSRRVVPPRRALARRLPVRAPALDEALADVLG